MGTIVTSPQEVSHMCVVIRACWFPIWRTVCPAAQSRVSSRPQVVGLLSGVGVWDSSLV